MVKTQVIQFHPGKKSSLPEPSTARSRRYSPRSNRALERGPTTLSHDNEVDSSRLRGLGLGSQLDGAIYADSCGCLVTNCRIYRSFCYLHCEFACSKCFISTTTQQCDIKYQPLSIHHYPPMNHSKPTILP